MYIGVDIGGTNLAAGVMDDLGGLVMKRSLPAGADRSTEAILDDVAKLVNELRQAYPDEIRAVGIGVPGVVSKENDYIYYCPNINMVKVRIKEEMEARLNLPVYADNDGNLAALAEHEIGALKDVDNGMLLTLGTGIGGGIIVDGKMLRGAHGLSSEVGHMVIGESDVLCNCGKNGCFETFSSATALIRETKRRLASTETPSVLRDLEEIDAKAIVDAAREEDPIGKAAYGWFLDYLALGIVNFINVLDPRIIALGGGLSNAGSFLLEPLEERIKALLFVKEFPHAKLVIAQLTNDAGILGAAFLARQKSKG